MNSLKIVAILGCICGANAQSLLQPFYGEYELYGLIVGTAIDVDEALDIAREAVNGNETLVDMLGTGTIMEGYVEGQTKFQQDGYITDSGHPDTHTEGKTFQLMGYSDNDTIDLVGGLSVSGAWVTTKEYGKQVT